MFANTLLSDDFSKKALNDLDLGLGFDNLQLNYNDQSIDNNPSISTSGLVNEIDSNNLIGSNSINSNNPKDIKSNEHFGSIVNINSIPKANIDNNNSNSREENDSLFSIEKNGHKDNNGLELEININRINDLSDFNQNELSELNLIEKKSSKNDDYLKKPTASNDFITLTTLNRAEPHLYLTDNFLQPIELLIEPLENRQSAAKNAKTNSSETSSAQKKSNSNIISKVKDSSNNSNKLKKTKRRSKLLNSSTTFSTNGNSPNTNNTNCLPETNSSKKSQESKSSKSKQNKTSIFGAISHTNSNSGVKSSILSSRKSENKQTKLARLKLESTSNKSNEVQSNIEPLNKKFAGSLETKTVNSSLYERISPKNILKDDESSLQNSTDLVTNSNYSTNNSNFLSTCSNDLSNDKNVIILQNLKKDEVDLHIKELSLLDLHSSEDDSNEFSLK